MRRSPRASRGAPAGMCTRDPSGPVDPLFRPPHPYGPVLYYSTPQQISRMGSSRHFEVFGTQAPPSPGLSLSRLQSGVAAAAMGGAGGAAGGAAVGGAAAPRLPSGLGPRIRPTTGSPPNSSAPAKK